MLSILANGTLIATDAGNSTGTSHESEKHHLDDHRCNDLQCWGK